MKKQVIVIEMDDAKRYKDSLLAIRKTLARAFEQSEDMGFRKFINRHGVVLDDLLEELGYRGRL